MFDFFVTQPNKKKAVIGGGLLTRKPEFGERYRHRCGWTCLAPSFLRLEQF